MTMVDKGGCAPTSGVTRNDSFSLGADGGAVTIGRIGDADTALPQGGRFRVQT